LEDSSRVEFSTLQATLRHRMSRRSKSANISRTTVGLPDRWLVPGVCLILAAITWLVFGQTLGHQFINFDDDVYVFKNPRISRGLTIDGIVWAFTHVHAANWHPLTWLSHMLDCQLYGLNPAGHHLTNVLLHTAAAIALFLVLKEMTGSLWRSAFVAALFAIHPLRVESVAWVAERKDVLSGLFFVLTLAAYVRYVRRPGSAARYGAVLVFFVLGLMSKPMLVTLPFVLLLLDYWPLNRGTANPGSDRNQPPTMRRLILEKLPMLVLAGAASLATLFAQKVALRPSADFSFPVKMGNAALSSVAYLRQMFWPSDLAAYYPFAVENVVPAKVLLSLIVLAGISITVFLQRRHRYLVTGWLWYLIMLGPIIGILQVGNQARADRYTYLPQIGLYLMVIWGGADVCARSQPRRVFAGLLLGIALVALTLTARSQAAYWQDSESLWTRALSRTSGNVMAELNLGEAVFKKGRTEEAIAHFDRALQIEPNEATVHGSLGAALLKMGRRTEAMTHLRRSLEIEPNQAPIQSTLGVVLLEDGRPDESLAHLLAAVAIDPDYGDAHYNLGNTLLRIGREKDALAEYDSALKINPGDTEALNNMAWILSTSPDPLARDGAKAVQLAERADRLTREASPFISATLAAAYAEDARFAEAAKAAERALRLATTEGNVSLSNSIRAQLELYRSDRPFREHH
jgi:tetratricopeptide (TPR) repeat protein